MPSCALQINAKLTLNTSRHSYPLITLSTRAQVESKKAQSSTLDAARRIVQREGITGLYAGLDSALFGISVTNFVYYYCSLSHCVYLRAGAHAHRLLQGMNGPAQVSSAPH